MKRWEGGWAGRRVIVCAGRAMVPTVLWCVARQALCPHSTLRAYSLDERSPRPAVQELGELDGVLSFCEMAMPLVSVSRMQKGQIQSPARIKLSLPQTVSALLVSVQQQQSPTVFLLVHGLGRSHWSGLLTPVWDRGGAGGTARRAVGPAGQPAVGGGFSAQQACYP